MKRPGLSVSLWAQYMLDNFSSVKQAVDFTAADSFQLVTGPIPKTGLRVAVHLSLSDPTGDSAVIEYLEGRPRVFHGREFTVMTNSPVFEKQIEALKQYRGFGGNLELSRREGTDPRFIRAAAYLKSIPKHPVYIQNVEAVFNAIRKISIPISLPGEASRPNLSPTRWRSVADLTNKIYYFEYPLHPKPIWVRLDDLNLRPGAPVKRLDIGRQENSAGDVSARFVSCEPFVFAVPPG